MKNRSLMLTLALVTLIASPLAQAQQTTPQLIKVQGFLSQIVGGVRVPMNGPATVVFDLYDAPVGGLLIVSTGPLPVTVNNGLYEVDLPFAASAFTAPSRFLELTVNGQTLAPRSQLASVPFAFTADKLDGLEGAALLQKAGDTMTGTLFLNPPSGPALIVNSGSVGIGTAAPGQLLSVAGVIESTVGGFKFPNGTIQTTATLVGPAGATGAQGAPGPQGPTGATGPQGPPGPAVHTSAVCATAGSCSSVTCNCAGGRTISQVNSPCFVTSDTGTCSANSFCSNCSFGCGLGQCCVCAP